MLGPFFATELFLNGGEGFHSTDVRGTVLSFDPNDASLATRAPLLVKSRGAEVGLRTRAIENLDSSVAFFWLDFASENLFVGDAGGTVFGRPSRRLGVEINNHYQPFPWLRFDGDVALTQARFRGFDWGQQEAYLDAVVRSVRICRRKW